MRLNLFFLAAVLFASTSVLSKMSECDADCEKNYKYCMSSGKGSSKSCLVDLEKCRKACLKAQKSGPAG